MSSNHVALIRRVYQEVWNKGNTAIAGEFVSPEYTIHDPLIKHEPGVKAFTHYVNLMRATFPDIQFTIEDLFESGDKVTTRWRAHGTQKSEFLGVPPTDKEVTVTGVTITRFSRGKIAESWTTWDGLGMMEQLGVDLLQTAGVGLW
jgi:steroid delta-isomerase-like uncharacterized protein